MPIHDWTRVDAEIFHDFHVSWIAEIKRALNRGVLPAGYYALAEQITGQFGPDVQTLRRPVDRSFSPESEPRGGVALAEAPPQVRFHAQQEIDAYAAKARTVVIRHRSRNQVIAMIEIISPGNKDRRAPFDAFINKAEQALIAGIHLLIVDLFPPTTRDPDGIHRAIWGAGRDGDFALPPDKPLTCVSYIGYPASEVFLEPVALGDPLPEMPLFLTPQTYVPVPLEPTYEAAWESVPDFLQDELSGPSANDRKPTD